MTLQRFFRWTGLALAGVVAAIVLALLVVYGWSEVLLRRHSPVRAVAMALPSDAASIAEGHRLMLVHGCAGCHGPQGQGGELLDEPLIAHIVSPNLTQTVRSFSDADLATAIRHGVRPDGRTMIVMPSQAFAPLTDADLGRIVAYLRSMPPVDGPGREISIGPIGRIGLLLAKFKTSLQLVEDAWPPGPAADAQAERGRYLARTTCVVCHGADLRGASHPEGDAPDLHIVAAYSPEAFTTLMHTGRGLGDRKLGIMTGWAKAYLASLTDDEVAALYAYLHSMPAASTQ